jgi:homocysteine S-methyltransferase
MLKDPNMVSNIHSAYFEAGATVATTNSYTILRDRLKHFELEHEVHSLWNSSVAAACKARDKFGSGRIAGSIGPLVASYRPDICPPVEEASSIYKEKVESIAPMVDILLVETVCSLKQAKGVLAATDNSNKPVWISFSVDDNDGTKLRSGENLEEVEAVINHHLVEAVLINCSPPEVVGNALSILSKMGLAFGAYANGFSKISSEFLKTRPTVDALTARKDLGPEEYSNFVTNWIRNGASIVGGCCEIGPAHISKIAQKIHELGYKTL